jgi:hypothetical protein
MKLQKALASLERAFDLDKTDARMLMELDQLYKRLCKPHAERLAFLEQYTGLVAQRDDLYLEFVTLCNATGQYLRAKELIDSRRFHPWEGGEGKVPAQYQLCRVELAKLAIEEAKYTSKPSNCSKNVSIIRITWEKVNCRVHRKMTSSTGWVALMMVWANESIGLMNAGKWPKTAFRNLQQQFSTTIRNPTRFSIRVWLC